MGCDIHAYLEVIDIWTDKWESLGPELELGRNYDSFAELSNVRGCAETGQSIMVPIPEDVLRMTASEYVKSELDKWGGEHHDLGVRVVDDDFWADVENALEVLQKQGEFYTLLHKLTRIIETAAVYTDGAYGHYRLRLIVWYDN